MRTTKRFQLKNSTKKQKYLRANETKTKNIILNVTYYLTLHHPKVR